MNNAGNEIKLEIGLHGDEAVVKGFQRVARHGEQTGNKLDRSFKLAGMSIGNFNGLLLGAGGAVAALTALAYSAKKLTDLADGWTMVEGRLKLVTNSSEQLLRVQKEIYNLSQESRSDFKSTADLYARMARSTAHLNKSDKELLQVTEAIGKAMVVSGASTQEAEASIVQFSQGLASGTLRGDELRSVLEQAPRLAQMIADGMGVTIGQLRELGKEGKLTTENLINAIGGQLSKVDAEFKQLPMTVGQAITKVNNSLGLMVSGGNKTISFTEQLAGGISWLADEITDLSGTVNSYLSAGKSAAEASGFSGLDMGIIGAALIGGGPGGAALAATILQINSLVKSGTGKGILDNIDSFTGLDKILEANNTTIESFQEIDRLRALISEKEKNRLSTYAIEAKRLYAELGTVTKATAAEDIKLLNDRLKEYEKFYAELGKQIEDNAKKQEQSIKDLNALYLQQIDLRRSTEGLLSGLGKGTGRSREDEYALSRSELDQQYQSALTLGGQEQLDALEKYKQAVNSLAQEFKDGFSGQRWDTSGSEITTQAIADIERAYELQKEVLSGLTSTTESQIETNRIWGEELTKEMAWAKEGIDQVKTTISELDDQIRAMDRVLKLRAEDLASSTIINVQSEIDRLHDKTITITTRHINTFSDGGPDSLPSPDPIASYAIGTQWVPKTGLYQLHQGESVTPAASAGSAGRGNSVTFGDINITMSGGSSSTDVRAMVRDQLMPEIREQLRHG